MNSLLLDVLAALRIAKRDAVLDVQSQLESSLKALLVIALPVFTRPVLEAFAEVLVLLNTVPGSSQRGLPALIDHLLQRGAAAADGNVASRAAAIFAAGELVYSCARPALPAIGDTAAALLTLAGPKEPDHAVRAAATAALVRVLQGCGPFAARIMPAVARHLQAHTARDAAHTVRLSLGPGLSALALSSCGFSILSFDALLALALRGICDRHSGVRLGCAHAVASILASAIIASRLGAVAAEAAGLALRARAMRGAGADGPSAAAGAAGGAGGHDDDDDGGSGARDGEGDGAGAGDGDDGAGGASGGADGDAEGGDGDGGSGGAAAGAAGKKDKGKKDKGSGFFSRLRGKPGASAAGSGGGGADGSGGSAFARGFGALARLGRKGPAAAQTAAEKSAAAAARAIALQQAGGGVVGIGAALGLTLPQALAFLCNALRNAGRFAHRAGIPVAELRACVAAAAAALLRSMQNAPGGIGDGEVPSIIAVAIGTPLYMRDRHPHKWSRSATGSSTAASGSSSSSSGAAPGHTSGAARRGSFGSASGDLSPAAIAAAAAAEDASGVGGSASSLYLASVATGPPAAGPHALQLRLSVSHVVTAGLLTPPAQGGVLPGRWQAWQCRVLGHFLAFLNTHVPVVVQSSAAVVRAVAAAAAAVAAMKQASGDVPGFHVLRVPAGPPLDGDDDDAEPPSCEHHAVTAALDAAISLTLACTARGSAERLQAAASLLPIARACLEQASFSLRLSAAACLKALISAVPALFAPLAASLIACMKADAAYVAQQRTQALVAARAAACSLVDAGFVPPGHSFSGSASSAHAVPATAGAGPAPGGSSGIAITRSTSFVGSSGSSGSSGSGLGIGSGLAKLGRGIGAAFGAGRSSDKEKEKKTSSSGAGAATSAAAAAASSQLPPAGAGHRSASSGGAAATSPTSAAGAGASHSPRRQPRIGSVMTHLGASPLHAAPGGVGVPGAGAGSGTGVVTGSPAAALVRLHGCSIALAGIIGAAADLDAANALAHASAGISPEDDDGAGARDEQASSAPHSRDESPTRLLTDELLLAALSISHRLATIASSSFPDTIARSLLPPDVLRAAGGVADLALSAGLAAAAELQAGAARTSMALLQAAAAAGGAALLQRSTVWPRVYSSIASTLLRYRAEQEAAGIGCPALLRTGAQALAAGRAGPSWNGAAAAGGPGALALCPSGPPLPIHTAAALVATAASAAGSSLGVLSASPTAASSSSPPGTGTAADDALFAIEAFFPGAGGLMVGAAALLSSAAAVGGAPAAGGASAAASGAASPPGVAAGPAAGAAAALARTRSLYTGVAAAWSASGAAAAGNALAAVCAALCDSAHTTPAGAVRLYGLCRLALACATAVPVIPVPLNDLREALRRSSSASDGSSAAGAAAAAKALAALDSASGRTAMEGASAATSRRLASGAAVTVGSGALTRDGARVGVIAGLATLAPPQAIPASGIPLPANSPAAADCVAIPGASASAVGAGAGAGGAGGGAAQMPVSPSQLAYRPFTVDDAHLASSAGVSLAAIAVTRRSVLALAAAALEATALLPLHSAASAPLRGPALCAAVSALTGGTLALQQLEMGLLSSLDEAPAPIVAAGAGVAGRQVRTGADDHDDYGDESRDAAEAAAAAFYDRVMRICAGQLSDAAVRPLGYWSPLHLALSHSPMPAVAAPACSQPAAGTAAVRGLNADSVAAADEDGNADAEAEAEESGTDAGADNEDGMFDGDAGDPLDPLSPAGAALAGMSLRARISPSLLSASPTLAALASGCAALARSLDTDLALPRAFAPMITAAPGAAAALAAALSQGTEAVEHPQSSGELATVQKASKLLAASASGAAGSLPASTASTSLVHSALVATALRSVAAAALPASGAGASGAAALQPSYLGSTAAATASNAAGSCLGGSYSDGSLAAVQSSLFTSSSPALASALERLQPEVRAGAAGAALLAALVPLLAPRQTEMLVAALSAPLRPFAFAPSPPLAALASTGAGIALLASTPSITAIATGSSSGGGSGHTAIVAPHHISLIDASGNFGGNSITSGGGGAAAASAGGGADDDDGALTGTGYRAAAHAASPSERLAIARNVAAALLVTLTVLRPEHVQALLAASSGGAAPSPAVAGTAPWLLHVRSLLATGICSADGRVRALCAAGLTQLVRLGGASMGRKLISALQRQLKGPAAAVGATAGGGADGGGRASSAALGPVATAGALATLAAMRRLTHIGEAAAAGAAPVLVAAIERLAGRSVSGADAAADAFSASSASAAVGSVTVDIEAVSAALALLDAPPLLPGSSGAVATAGDGSVSPVAVASSSTALISESVILDVGRETKQPVRAAALQAWETLLSSAVDDVSCAARAHRAAVRLARAAVAAEESTTSAAADVAVAARLRRRADASLHKAAQARDALLAAATALRRFVTPTLSLLEAHSLAATASPFDSRAQASASVYGQCTHPNEGEGTASGAASSSSSSSSGAGADGAASAVAVVPALPDPLVFARSPQLSVVRFAGGAAVGSSSASAVGFESAREAASGGGGAEVVGPVPVGAGGAVGGAGGTVFGAVAAGVRGAVICASDPQLGRSDAETDPSAWLGSVSCSGDTNSETDAAADSAGPLSLSSGPELQPLLMGGGGTIPSGGAIVLLPPGSHTITGPGSNPSVHGSSAGIDTFQLHLSQGSHAALSAGVGGAAVATAAAAAIASAPAALAAASGNPSALSGSGALPAGSGAGACGTAPLPLSLTDAITLGGVGPASVCAGGAPPSVNADGHPSPSIGLHNRAALAAAALGRRVGVAGAVLLPVVDPLTGDIIPPAGAAKALQREAGAIARGAGYIAGLQALGSAAMAGDFSAFAARARSGSAAGASGAVGAASSLPSSRRGSGTAAGPAGHGPSGSSASGSSTLATAAAAAAAAAALESAHALGHDDDDDDAMGGGHGGGGAGSNSAFALLKQPSGDAEAGSCMLPTAFAPLGAGHAALPSLDACFFGSAAGPGSIAAGAPAGTAHTCDSVPVIPSQQAMQAALDAAAGGADAPAGPSVASGGAASGSEKAGTSHAGDNHAAYPSVWPGFSTDASRSSAEGSIATVLAAYRGLGRLAAASAGPVAARATAAAVVSALEIGLCGGSGAAAAALACIPDAAFTSADAAAVQAPLARCLARLARGLALAAPVWSEVLLTALSAGAPAGPEQLAAAQKGCEAELSSISQRLTQVAVTLLSGAAAGGSSTAVVAAAVAESAVSLAQVASYLPLTGADESAAASAKSQAQGKAAKASAAAAAAASKSGAAGDGEDDDGAAADMSMASASDPDGLADLFSGPPMPALPASSTALVATSGAPLAGAFGFPTMSTSSALMLASGDPSAAAAAARAAALAAVSIPQPPPLAASAFLLPLLALLVRGVSDGGGPVTAAGLPPAAATAQPPAPTLPPGFAAGGSGLGGGPGAGAGGAGGGGSSASAKAAAQAAAAAAAVARAAALREFPLPLALGGWSDGAVHPHPLPALQALAGALRKRGSVSVSAPAHTGVAAPATAAASVPLSPRRIDAALHTAALWVIALERMGFRWAMPPPLPREMLHQVTLAAARQQQHHQAGKVPGAASSAPSMAAGFLSHLAPSASELATYVASAAAAPPSGIAGAGGGIPGASIAGAALTSLVPAGLSQGALGAFAPESAGLGLAIALGYGIGAGAAPPAATSALAAAFLPLPGAGSGHGHGHGIMSAVAAASPAALLALASAFVTLASGAPAGGSAASAAAAAISAATGALSSPAAQAAAASLAMAAAHGVVSPPPALASSAQSSLISALDARALRYGRRPGSTPPALRLLVALAGAPAGSPLQMLASHGGGSSTGLGVGALAAELQRALAAHSRALAQLLLPPGGLSAAAAAAAAETSAASASSTGVGGSAPALASGEVDIFAAPAPAPAPAAAPAAALETSIVPLSSRASGLVPSRSRARHAANSAQALLLLSSVDSFAALLPSAFASLPLVPQHRCDGAGTDAAACDDSSGAGSGSISSAALAAAAGFPALARAKGTYQSFRLATAVSITTAIAVLRLLRNHSAAAAPFGMRRSAALESIPVRASIGDAAPLALAASPWAALAQSGGFVAGLIDLLLNGSEDRKHGSASHGSSSSNAMRLLLALQLYAAAVDALYGGATPGMQWRVRAAAARALRRVQRAAARADAASRGGGDFGPAGGGGDDEDGEGEEAEGGAGGGGGSSDEEEEAAVEFAAAAASNAAADKLPLPAPLSSSAAVQALLNAGLGLGRKRRGGGGDPFATAGAALAAGGSAGAAAAAPAARAGIAFDASALGTCFAPEGADEPAPAALAAALASAPQPLPTTLLPAAALGVAGSAAGSASGALKKRGAAAAPASAAAAPGAGKGGHPLSFLLSLPSAADPDAGALYRLAAAPALLVDNMNISNSSNGDTGNEAALAALGAGAADAFALSAAFADGGLWRDASGAASSSSFAASAQRRSAIRLLTLTIRRWGALRQLASPGAGVASAGAGAGSAGAAAQPLSAPQAAHALAMVRAVCSRISAAAHALLAATAAVSKATSGTASSSAAAAGVSAAEAAVAEEDLSLLSALVEALAAERDPDMPSQPLLEQVAPALQGALLPILLQSASKDRSAASSAASVLPAGMRSAATGMALHIVRSGAISDARAASALLSAAAASSSASASGARFIAQQRRSGARFIAQLLLSVLAGVAADLKRDLHAAAAGGADGRAASGSSAFGSRARSAASAADGLSWGSAVQLLSAVSMLLPLAQSSGARAGSAAVDEPAAAPTPLAMRLATLQALAPGLPSLLQAWVSPSAAAGSAASRRAVAFVALLAGAARDPSSPDAILLARYLLPASAAASSPALASPADALAHAFGLGRAAAVQLPASFAALAFAAQSAAATLAEAAPASLGALVQAAVEHSASTDVIAAAAVAGTLTFAGAASEGAMRALMLQAVDFVATAADGEAKAAALSVLRSLAAAAVRISPPGSGVSHSGVRTLGASVLRAAAAGHVSAAWLACAGDSATARLPASVQPPAVLLPVAPLEATGTDSSAAASFGACIAAGASAVFDSAGASAHALAGAAALAVAGPAVEAAAAASALVAAASMATADAGAAAAARLGAELLWAAANSSIARLGAEAATGAAVRCLAPLLNQQLAAAMLPSLPPAAAGGSDIAWTEAAGVLVSKLRPSEDAAASAFALRCLLLPALLGGCLAAASLAAGAGAGLPSGQVQPLLASVHRGGTDGTATAAAAIDMLLQAASTASDISAAVGVASAGGSASGSGASGAQAAALSIALARRSLAACRLLLEALTPITKAAVAAAATASAAPASSLPSTAPAGPDAEGRAAALVALLGSTSARLLHLLPRGRWTLALPGAAGSVPLLLDAGLQAELNAAAVAAVKGHVLASALAQAKAPTTDPAASSPAAAAIAGGHKARLFAHGFLALVPLLTPSCVRVALHVPGDIAGDSASDQLPSDRCVLQPWDSRWADTDALCKLAGQLALHMGQTDAAAFRGALGRLQPEPARVWVQTAMRAALSGQHGSPGDAAGAAALRCPAFAAAAGEGASDVADVGELRVVPDAAAAAVLAAASGPSIKAPAAAVSVGVTTASTHAVGLPAAASSTGSAVSPQAATVFAPAAAVKPGLGMSGSGGGLSLKRPGGGLSLNLDKFKAAAAASSSAPAKPAGAGAGAPGSLLADFLAKQAAGGDSSDDEDEEADGVGVRARTDRDDEDDSDAEHDDAAAEAAPSTPT